MKDPLVSILIPFKDTAHYLPECIDSILVQEYPHWEILAVNDNSRDTSRAIMDTYADKDARITVLENPGEGIIDALRCAYGNSHGPMVTRMDSDDIMVPDKLQVLARSLQQYGKGHIAVGQVRYFSDHGISNGYARYETWLNALTAKGTNYTEIYKECVIPSPCWMVHKEDLDRCGAFDPERYPEDYDLTFRFYQIGLICIPCTQVLHLWRDYETRTSRTSEHYAQNYFLEIKLRYFLDLEKDLQRPLTVWGAGNKGKEIAKGLLDRQINFHWLCDNPNKIGKLIYGQEMRHYSHLTKIKRPQSIITVANKAAQTMIHAYFNDIGLQHGQDYFFFC